MTLEIASLNGNDWVNIVPFIAYGGFKWQRADVDGPDSGRDLTGDLMRDRITTKVRLDITCRLLKSHEAQIVLSSIMPEWVSVRYYDPQEGTVVEKTMYSNNNPASYQIKKPDGTEWWSGITFPLIEK